MKLVTHEYTYLGDGGAEVNNTQLGTLETVSCPQVSIRRFRSRIGNARQTHPLDLVP
jgi:hypothetical protein